MAREETKPEQPKRGFDEKGERVVIELAELRKTHGKRADDIYRQISTLVGGGPGSGIVTPLAEHERDLSLVGIKPEVRQQVEALLASKGE